MCKWNSCLNGTTWSTLQSSSCLYCFLPWLSILPEIPNSRLLFISNAAYAGTLCQIRSIPGLGITWSTLVPEGDLVY